MNLHRYKNCLAPYVLRAIRHVGCKRRWNDDNHEQENESDANIEENEVLGEPFVILIHG